MTYIVLDMEWSQPVSKEKTVTVGTLSLPVEIIQIGAVIVKDGKVLPERFSEYIKPMYYKVIKREIRKITGIDEKTLARADGFEQVMDKFREWCTRCGGDTIVTWGPDDIPLLRSQCMFFGYDDKWIPDWFNLQPIFTAQHGIDRPQITLTAATEIIGADSGLDYHSAINDAYYTALVLLSVDNLPDRLARQRKIDFVRANPYITLSLKVYGNKKYSRMSAAMKTVEFNRYACPICGRPATLKNRWVCVRPREYLVIMKCRKHSIAVTAEFKRGENKRFSWLKTIAPSNKKQERLYAELSAALPDTTKSSAK